MKTIYLVIFLLIVFTGYNYSQGENISNSIIGIETTQYKEKIYVHLDKSYYNAGEDIWFKVYLLNASTHVKEVIPNVVYVDIIGLQNDIIGFHIVKIENGVGTGDFELPSNLNGGEYMVRAYTNYMRNFDEAYFFTKQIYISPLNFIKGNTTISLNTNNQGGEQLVFEGQRPDLQFFPEGGQMVNDYFNRVGFKVIGVDGKSIDISGVIVDDAGAEVTVFTSANFGMGIFDVKPVLGKEYTANIMYNGKKYSYTLPKGVEGGILLRVQELRDYYQINIQTSSPSGLKGYSLTAAQRNGEIFNGKINQDKAIAVFKVDKKLIATGIAQFTLFNDKNIALCERLVFYDDGSPSSSISIIPTSLSYALKDNVELDIEMNGTEGMKQNLGANISISVTNLAASAPREHQSDICTYLLLNSEIKGEIEQPGYYFYSVDPKRKQHLDLLMMTQGWRQFILNEEPKTEGGNLEFIKEIGITVEGRVRKFHNPEKPDVATVKLTFQDSDVMGRLNVKSNEDGHFKFLGLNIKEDNKLAFEIIDYERPMKEFAIQLDSLKPAPIATTKMLARSMTKVGYNQFMDNPTERKDFDAMFENEMMKLIQLDEVLVVTEGKSKKKEMDIKRSTRSIYSTVSNTLDFSEIRNMPYPDILAALRARVPGVDVYGGYITIRGINSMSSERGSTPLFLLNGVPVNQEAIENVPVWEVDFIDILKGARASIFGSEGGNGVIAVYTLTGKELQSQDNIIGKKVFKYQGFYQSRKFYEPVYGNDNLDGNRRKFGSTLYWEPVVELDMTGKAKVKFPAGNKSSTYKAVLQGITNDGLPIATETIFKVE